MFRFKEFINDNDIKQRELMELFSVSQPYVSNLVNGKMPLQDDKIEILRKKYGDIVDGYKTDDDIVRANGVEAKWVPLVPILAMGGSLNEFNQGIGNMEDGETFLIGRDISKCAIICNSAKVSRVHVSITCQCGDDGHTEYLVRDLSTNGTISSMTGFLPKNQDVLIRPGTEIGLGRSDETIKFLE